MLLTLILGFVYMNMVEAQPDPPARFKDRDCKPEEVYWERKQYISEKTYAEIYGCIKRAKIISCFEELSTEQKLYAPNLDDCIRKYVAGLHYPIDMNVDYSFHWKFMIGNTAIRDVAKFTEETLENLEKVYFKVKKQGESKPEDKRKNVGEIYMIIWRWKEEEVDVLWSFKTDKEWLCSLIVEFQKDKENMDFRRRLEKTLLNNPDYFRLTKNKESKLPKEYRISSIDNIHAWSYGLLNDNRFYGSLLAKMLSWWDKDKTFNEENQMRICEERIWKIDVEVHEKKGHRKSTYGEALLGYKYQILIVTVLIIAANGLGIVTCEKLRSCSSSTSDTTSTKKDD